MGDNIEYQVLLHLTSQLELEFEGDIDLAHFLNREGYIKDNDYSDVINPKSLLSRNNKSSILVSGIKHKVASYPERYYGLIDHLRSNSRKYGDIVNLLDVKFSECFTIES